MKKYFYLQFVVLIILLTACSRPVETEGLDYSHIISYSKKNFEFISSDKDVRKELGIGLETSPDGTMYFIKDEPSSHFQKVFLVDAENRETEIFDFKSIYGELERDNTNLEFFWGGNSDRIFMYKPYAEELFLKQYLLDKQSWEDVPIDLPKYDKVIDSIEVTVLDKVITSIHGTDLLVIQGDSQYYSLDLSNNEKKELNIPRVAYLHDQKGSKILFTRMDLENENIDTKYTIGIYDVEKNDVEYLALPIPASDYNSYFTFLPNDTNKISYMAETNDLENGLTSYLIIYDYVENKFEEIFIGKGSKSFIGWNLEGNSFYGLDYIITIDER